ncbi:hypothetical protein PFISCL1PPCAC_21550, partial [Pristionchus fissidentatus]
LVEFIDAAKNEINAKFVHIIAQAISRCMDLMAQTEAVGMARCEEIDKRISEIHAISDKIQRASRLSTRYDRISNLAVIKCMRSAAYAMCEPIREEFEYLRAQPVPLRTSKDIILNLSFPPNIISHIANLGKVIKTNILDN